MRNIFNSLTGSFFRTIGRILAYVVIGLAIAYFSGFINIGSVNALSNIDIFEDLTISDNGMFYNNTNASGANSDLGYEVATGSYGQNYEYEYYYAVSETETQLINYGVSLTQCGMNLKAGRNYSIIYYFKSGGSPYIYPNYANTTYKLGISNDVSTANLSFNPSEWYADNIGTPLPGNFNTVHSFILTFEAPTNGACLSVSYSSKTSNVSSHQYLFLGYELTDHGEHVPTVEEIKDGLESSFDDLYNNFLDATISINNAIDAMHDHLNGNINASTNEILDKQEETNQALDDLNDSITSTEGADLDGLADSAGWLPPGPIDSILNLPLTYLNSLTTSLGDTCNPVTLSLPFIDQDISLPCLSSIYSEIDGLDVFINMIGVIASGLILFSYLMNLYKWVDKTLSFRENHWLDNWGGL